MGGTAIAAKHYLITSTKQIKPSVLKALKGNTGPKGAAGAAGTSGAKGETGTKGESGAKGETGASATAIWGVIEEGGPTASGSGIVSSRHSGTGGDGEYEVVFNRDVSKCAINVTVRTFVGFGSVTNVSGDAIRVRTREEAGKQEDEPFYVAVFC